VNSYYRGAHGILLVYDLTDPSSATSLRMWLQEIEKFAKEGIPVILVGNKADLIHPSGSTQLQQAQLTQIIQTRQIISELQNDFPLLHNYECSAKSGENIEESFLQMIKMMIKEKQENYLRHPPSERKEKKTNVRIQRTGNELLSSDSVSCCGT
jgi:Ras-related protein Rab-1A